MYKVNHYSYSGMHGVPACFDTEQEARTHVAARLRRYRKHFPLQVLSRGEEWEILEPEGVSMVPDACGTLGLVHVTWECRECGSECETQHDALHCCAERYLDDASGEFYETDEERDV